MLKRLKRLASFILSPIFEKIALYIVYLAAPNHALMQKWLLVIFFCSFGLAGFAQLDENAMADPDTLEGQFYGQLMGLDLNKDSNGQLYKNIYDWLGTPYRYGGETKRGIDCSGFTNKVYTAAYNAPLPSNSRAIWQASEPVEKSELKEGDFVFFKIRRGQISHIGIYLGNDKFAHASVSNGVIISDLNESYYRRYFYKGGRLIAQPIPEETSSDN